MRTPSGLHRALPRALFRVGLLALFSGTLSASAQVVPLDLLTRVSALETGATQTGTGLSTLRTDVGDLRTTLGTVNSNLAATTAKVTDIEGQLGDLRGLLGGLDVPDVIDVTGPVDVSDLVRTLNRQVVATAANANAVATANVSIGDLRGKNAEQDTRLADHEIRITQNTTVLAAHGATLDDHERRISRNTDDIRSQGLAIADLQSQMTDGLLALSSELESQSRRISKATEGVAMALAMKSPAVPDDKEFAVSGSFGAFEGKTALAFAGGIRATDALQFDAGLAVGLDRGSVGGRAGATLAW